MNDRIKEIAIGAGLKLKSRRPWDDLVPDGYLESDNDFIQNNEDAVLKFLEGGLEEFAQLIVNVCMYVIERTIESDCDSDDAKMGCEFAITNISDHFGVK